MVLNTRDQSSGSTEPQPFLRDANQHTPIIATTIRMPGMMPATNRSEIDRFIRNP